MSIDLYPALDAGEIDVAVALERVATAGRVAPLGAASLLYQNDDERWPEEQGDDSSSRYPGIELHEPRRATARRSATCSASSCRSSSESDEPTLVTLTVGGNDLLSAFAHKPRRVAARARSRATSARRTSSSSTRCAARARTRSSLLTTIYDPSDGTGRIPGVLEGCGRRSCRSTCWTD